MEEHDDRIIYLDIESLLSDYNTAEQEVLLLEQAHPEFKDIPIMGFERLQRSIEQLNIQPIFMADRRKKRKRRRQK